MSYTPFNAPLLSGLFGDMEIAAHFSVKSDITAMLAFEVALAQAQSEHGIIPADAATQISNSCETFEPDIRALSTATVSDGLVVPNLIKQLRSHIGEPASQFLHFGSTSQDVIDTSLILRLAKIIQVYENRLAVTIKLLSNLKSEFGKNALMGRTRMQAALPITAGDRIENWLTPIQAQLHKLEAIKKELLKVQYAGPVGTLEKLGEKGQPVRDSVAHILGLETGRSWQTDRTSLSDFCHWLAVTCGALGKIGKDITLMSQQGINEVSIKGGGSSSAMPHKQNPIKAETLSTLAQYTNIQAGGFYNALDHEQERSGSAWSLEWMLLPQICVSTGASLRVANELLESIQTMGSSENAAEPSTDD